MKARLNYMEQSPKFMQKLMQLSQVVSDSSLGHTLITLAQTRASQMNGCTFCVDMHVKEGKIQGERELRLYHIPVWRESTLFTDKERAVLEWTEVVTDLDYRGIPDDVYNRTREHLSEKEITELTYAIGIINVWNRLNASFRTVPGGADKMFGLDKANLK